MRKLNLIVVFSTNLDKVLFCIRAKEPYKGLYNFVGGKVENGETKDDAAYKAMGNSYVRFARDYPEFFKIMFMQKAEMNADNYAEIDYLGDEIIKTGQKFTGLSFEEQKEFHLKVWFFTHGIATLIVTGTIKLTDEEIDKLLETTVRQMLKGYKIEKGEKR